MKILVQLDVPMIGKVVLHFLAERLGNVQPLQEARQDVPVLPFDAAMHERTFLPHTESLLFVVREMPIRAFFDSRPWPCCTPCSVSFQSARTILPRPDHGSHDSSGTDMPPYLTRLRSLNRPAQIPQPSETTMHRRTLFQHARAAQTCTVVSPSRTTAAPAEDNTMPIDPRAVAQLAHDYTAAWNSKSAERGRLVLRRGR